MSESGDLKNDKYALSDQIVLRIEDILNIQDNANPTTCVPFDNHQTEAKSSTQPYRNPNCKSGRHRYSEPYKKDASIQYEHG